MEYSSSLDKVNSILDELDLSSSESSFFSGLESLLFETSEESWDKSEEEDHSLKKRKRRETSLDSAEKLKKNQKNLQIFFSKLKNSTQAKARIIHNIC